MDRANIALVRNQLYLQGKTQKDLAEELGMSYGYLRQILQGADSSKKLEKRILERVGVICNDENESLTDNPVDT